MRILAEDPGRWQRLGRLLVHKLRIALSLLEDMALEPPRVRLVRCLVNLLEGYGQRKAEPSLSVRVSQERLGMMLSLNRQTVNELLRHLEQKSIVHYAAEFASLTSAGSETLLVRRGSSRVAIDGYRFGGAA